MTEDDNVSAAGGLEGMGSPTKMSDDDKFAARATSEAIWVGGGAGSPLLGASSSLTLPPGSFPRSPCQVGLRTAQW